MAYELPINAPGLVADDDYSADQFKFVKITGVEQIGLCNSQGERCVGVLQDAPSADGMTATVAVLGVTKIVCGEGITAGMWLTPGQDAQAEEADTSDYIAGIALQSGSTDEIISMLLLPGGVSA